MKSIIYGVLAGAGLITLYAITMTVLAKSFTAAIEQFQALWWLMLPLALGFGLQVGLFVKLRQKQQQRANGTLAAGGGSATVGMLACCSHHLADVLPFLGLSALSIFLLQYQIPILVFSIAVNFLGVLMMIKKLRSIYEN